jgi:hypothetical protein
MWGALSDERTGLFTIAAGPRQRSHSRVRVPWDFRQFFSASHSRLPILSPPTTRKATVKVFDPASTRDLMGEFLQNNMYKISSYLTENILRLHYKDQPVNAA